jgi:pyruvate/2-oxoglutarate dehydrogenase complex dihydrolipoamide dehydrogenase (E3) component
MYRRFGSRVTVIEQSARIMGREDTDVSDAVQAILEEEGVNFRLSAECLAVRREGDGIAVRVSCDDGPEEVVGTHLLVAVGGFPTPMILASSTLASRWTSVATSRLMTNCNRRYRESGRRVSDRITCYGLFVDPPLGRIGMTEAEIRALGRPALIGIRPMSRVGRAREFGDARWFMKVLVDAETKRILGASILGLHGDEAVHGLLNVMYADLPYTTISRSVPIHPTVSELIPTLLQELRPL